MSWSSADDPIPEAAGTPRPHRRSDPWRTSAPASITDSASPPGSCTTKHRPQQRWRRRRGRRAHDPVIHTNRRPVRRGGLTGDVAGCRESRRDSLGLHLISGCQRLGTEPKELGVWLPRSALDETEHRDLIPPPAVSLHRLACSSRDLGGHVATAADRHHNRPWVVMHFAAYATNYAESCCPSAACTDVLRTTQSAALAGPGRCRHEARQRAVSFAADPALNRGSLRRLLLAETGLRIGAERTLVSTKWARAERTPPVTDGSRPPSAASRATLDAASASAPLKTGAEAPRSSLVGRHCGSLMGSAWVDWQVAQATDPMLEFGA